MGMFLINIPTFIIKETHMNAQVNFITGNKLVKPYMSVNHLEKSNAKIVAVMKNDGNLFESDKFEKYPTENLTKHGFYFLVSNGVVAARFYIGRQRSKCGFEAVARHIRAGRSKVCKQIIAADQVYAVYYVAIEHMKPLTVAVNKNKIGTMLTRSYNDRFQNLEEMNRILSDNFKFSFQKF